MYKSEICSLFSPRIIFVMFVFLHLRFSTLYIQIVENEDIVIAPIPNDYL